jgi:hypothetical protein
LQRHLGGLEFSRVPHTHVMRTLHEGPVHPGAHAHTRGPAWPATHSAQRHTRHVHKQVVGFEVLCEPPTAHEGAQVCVPPRVCADTHPLSSPHRPRCRALHTQRSRSGCRSTELDPSSHTGTGCWPCTHRGQSSTAPKPTSQPHQQTISCHLLRCGQQYENQQVAWRDITAKCHTQTCTQLSLHVGPL